MNTVSVIRDIPLSKLVPSDANVRRTGRETGIEELAASIAAHGLLQNVTVRPVQNGKGEETSTYEVVAGARRMTALKLLAKRKVIAKSYAVPCMVLGAGSAEEVSLAENVFQCPMHPADQYEAFAKLHNEQGMAAEDIAARFGVTPTVVKQRMKLGAVSPVLMQVYRDGGMTLDQLMAFTITDDHAAQERVWSELSWNKSREMIRHMLMEGRIPATDRRAVFVGAEAYEAAGGVIVRDLFDDSHGGFFEDAALLDRLVWEKLDAEAERVAAEGWKWTKVTLEFDYGLTSGMRRVYPEPVPLTDEEQARLDALADEYDSLCIRAEQEDAAEELGAEIAAVESEIDMLQDKTHQYRPEDVAHAGAFVSLGYDGTVRIERGFIRPEDDIRAEPQATEDEASAPVTDTPDVADGSALDMHEDRSERLTALSDSLIEELTAYRTAGLRDALAQDRDVALRAVVHALASSLFYRYGAPGCLEIEAKNPALSRHAPGIAESPAERRIAECHDAWAAQLPPEPRDLWSFVLNLELGSLHDLLAHCASLTVHAVETSWDRRPGRRVHADRLAQALALDMTFYWTPTVNSYLGRVTKACILQSVREAVSDEAAERISDMKKQPMAEAAEQLLAGTGWLPDLLRTPELAEPGQHEPKAAEAVSAS